METNGLTVIIAYFQGLQKEDKLSASSHKTIHEDGNTGASKI
jgi:hypothetical protein